MKNVTVPTQGKSQRTAHADSPKTIPTAVMTAATKVERKSNPTNILYPFECAATTPQYLLAYSQLIRFIR
jgi:hypothetical protein